MNPHARDRERMRSSDRGSAEPLFILPLVMVMVMGVLQVGVWAHAQHRIQMIASQALAAARAYDGSTALAHEQAAQARQQLGSRMLRDVDVQVDRDTNWARVRIEARTMSLMPGVGVPVISEMSGPVETLAP